MDLKSFSEEDLLNLFFSFGSSPSNQQISGKALLEKSGSLRNLLRATPVWFQQQGGIGPYKAYRLAAILELWRRSERMILATANIFSEVAALKRYLQISLEYESREIFLVLFLDAQHRLIHCKKLFLGTFSQVAVFPREVLRYALLYQAAAFVVAHNHPSGDLHPSQCDLDLTQLLLQACSFLDLRFLDHFLVANYQVLSFLEHGWMPSD